MHELVYLVEIEDERSQRAKLIAKTRPVSVVWNDVLLLIPVYYNKHNRNFAIGVN